MKKLTSFILLFLFVLSLCGCDIHSAADTKQDATFEDTPSDTGSDAEDHASTEETQSVINADAYIVQTSYYQIYEVGLGKYRYRIANGENVIVDETKVGTPPEIEEYKGLGILRLFLAFGTNAFTVQYFDISNETVSEEFYPYTICADYVNRETKEYYIAYFQPEVDPKLYIYGFFDCSGFSAVLDLDFSMPSCEKIIFLNGEEIYIEYTNGNSESVREIVNYKNSLDRK